MNLLEQEIKQIVRDVPDFPKPGILFKDLTPVLANPDLCKRMTDVIADQALKMGAEAVAGIEARGFWFGMLIAQRLSVPFIPVRKAGKLPYDTLSYSYDLEYGSATVEMHLDAVKPGTKVLIHDDLLATGGTAAAAAELINQVGSVVGFSFLVKLNFLEGENVLNKYSTNIHSLIEY